MKKTLIGLSILSAPVLAASPVYAHAFGQRYDLPIPLSYFMAGAAATVALSFVIIGMFLKGGGAEYQYPRFNLLALPGTALTSRIKSGVARVLSVLLLLLVIATSFVGTDNALENFSPTFAWIIWWVGMGYISALFGNLWMLINPWKALFEWAEWLLQRAGTGMPAPRPYPAGWDAMPALIAFLGFVWLENVYPGSIVPRYLGAIIIVYSLYTLGGMLVFGKHVWLRYGDPFAVLFGIFARFSPTEVRVVGGGCGGCELDCDTDNPVDDCVDCYACYERADAARRQFNLRPWATGLVSIGRVSWQTCAFVVLTLAAVTFDGFQETTNWLGVQTIGLRLLGPGGVSVVDTFGVVLIPLLFFGIYLLFCIGIRALSGERASLSEVARAYVFSLGADRARIQYGALHVAAVSAGAAHHPASVRPVRLRLGHLWICGLSHRPHGDKHQVRVDRLGKRDSRGAHRIGVYRSHHSRQAHANPRASPARSVSDARADGLLHGGQPLDNRTAYRGAVGIRALWSCQAVPAKKPHCFYYGVRLILNMRLTPLQRTIERS